MDPRNLREATRAEHEATEALMPLMNGGLTRDTYIAVLQTLHPLLLGWEEWAARSAPEGLRELLPRRRRGHLLLADLKALGAEPDSERAFPVDWDAVVAGTNMPKESESEWSPAFLGALYVVEGSTLGGRYIARHVEDVLGLEPGAGDAYFRGYGEATGVMWREVLEQIAGVGDEHAALVIGAARRTFASFGEVLSEGLACCRTGATLTHLRRKASNSQ